jgi:hypothetical protein
MLPSLTELHMCLPGHMSFKTNGPCAIQISCTQHSSLMLGGATRWRCMVPKMVSVPEEVDMCLPYEFRNKRALGSSDILYTRFFFDVAWCHQVAPPGAHHLIRPSTNQDATTPWVSSWMALAFFIYLVYKNSFTRKPLAPDSATRWHQLEPTA